MISVALRLLDRHDINVNQVNKNGETALIFACKNNMKTVALKILERPITIISYVDNYKKSAINYAIENKMFSVISRITEITHRELFEYEEVFM